MLSEHALKCENNAIFEQKYTLKLLFAFKKGDSRYSRFPPKKVL